MTSDPTAQLRGAAATGRVAIVPVDCNGILDQGFVALDTLGVDWGLDRLGLRIREGLRLRGYDFDADQNDKPDHLVTEGTVELWPAYGSHKDLWVLHMDYLKHQSELDSPDHWSLTTDLAALDREISDWGKAHSQSGHAAHKYARKD
jgi:hypothetical protein